MNGKYKLVEKKNHLAVHAIFDSQGSAERHLKETIPEYVQKGYFMDKSLTKDSFEILPPQQVQKPQKNPQ